MSVYVTTSMQEVFARVVRNTRLQDASFLQDMPEWIPEAMGYMKTKYQLAPRWKDLRVEFHKARMPCGLVDLRAVQYGRSRLRFYNGERSFDSVRTSTVGAASVYPGIPEVGATPFNQQIVRRPAVDEGEDVEFFETDIRQAECLPFHGEHSYYTELNYINTSMADAIIRAHYYGIPVDAQGLPLIPDEENYKEALYWYVRAKMIGAGYEDKVFREDVCMQRFESYAARAISKITYPSVDKAAEMVDRLTRLIMPMDYWTSFGNPSTESTYLAI